MNKCLEKRQQNNSHKCHREYHTLVWPCTDNAIDSKMKFWIYFFANKKFIVFLEGLFLLVLFYAIYLIVSYLLNELSCVVSTYLYGAFLTLC